MTSYDHGCQCGEGESSFQTPRRHALQEEFFHTFRCDMVKIRVGILSISNCTHIQGMCLSLARISRVSSTSIEIRSKQGILADRTVLGSLPMPLRSPRIIWDTKKILFSREEDLLPCLIQPLLSSGVILWFLLQMSRPLVSQEPPLRIPRVRVYSPHFHHADERNHNLQFIKSHFSLKLSRLNPTKRKTSRSSLEDITRQARSFVPKVSWIGDNFPCSPKTSPLV